MHRDTVDENRAKFSLLVPDDGDLAGTCLPIEHDLGDLVTRIYIYRARVCQRQVDL